MVNVILEIAKKEISSYYGKKSIIIQNALLLLVFCYLPITQVNGILASEGYRSSILSMALDAFLLVAAFSPIVIASGIAIFAFPVERDQKTMEHLLSLPLTNGEIFLGKALASIVTGLAGVAVVFSIVIGFTIFASGQPIIWDAPLLTPSLAVLIFGVVPAVIVLSTLMIVALSSLIANARSAYIFNLVIMGVMIGLVSAKAALPVDATVYNGGVLVLIAIMIVVTYVVGVRAFSREKLIAKA
jgi:ABC-2 type transport system permease protein